MTRDAAIMYAVATVAGVAGLFLLARLRGSPSEARRYGSLMAGVMLVALCLVLGIFATAQIIWSRSP